MCIYGVFSIVKGKARSAGPEVARSGSGAGYRGERRLLKLNRLPEAVKSYQASMTIRQALTKADPDNADWQHDLSASYAALAEAYRKMGKTADARAALASGHAIVATYAAKNPDSADWKKDLDWFNRQIAEMGSRLGFSD